MTAFLTCVNIRNFAAQSAKIFGDNFDDSKNRTYICEIRSRGGPFRYTAKPCLEDVDVFMPRLSELSAQSERNDPFATTRLILRECGVPAPETSKTKRVNSHVLDILGAVTQGLLEPMSSRSFYF